VLAEKRSEQVPPAEAARILAREVLAGTCPLKKWDHAIGNGLRDSTSPPHFSRAWIAADSGNGPDAVD
jgi:hypothetical protein